MTVNEKQADIAILRTMGASPGLIQRIFLVQGLAIGLLGSLAGVGLGLLIALNIDVIVPAIEAIFRVRFLPRDVYFISELPSDVRLSDVLTVGLMAFGLICAWPPCIQVVVLPKFSLRRHCVMSNLKNEFLMQ
jgi:lipoprotein-releasing system permease protein